MDVPGANTRRGLGNTLCILMVVAISLRFAGANRNKTAVLSQLLEGYDNRVRPDSVDLTSLKETDEAPPVRIRVEIFIESVDSIKESTMDFSVTLYLRMFWQDPRLAFRGNRSLVLSSQGIEKIWIPDIYFLYEKNARAHMITQRNRLMRIQPSGKLSFSERISLTVSCNMLLQKFPMDSQKCTIIFSSYAYPMDEIILYADNQSMTMDPGISISKFELTGTDIENDKLMFSLGEFSSIKCSFVFERQMESYFLTVYIPTLLLVGVAWLSFWIDARAAPARVSLGITTVLTVTTTTTGIQEAMPAVTYAKAIDIWLVVCLTFVFFSLLEYATANYLLLKAANGTKSPSGVIESGEQKKSRPRQASTCNCKRPMTADRLDRIARWLYPLTFLTFAVIYWIVFLTM